MAAVVAVPEADEVDSEPTLRTSGWRTGAVLGVVIMMAVDSLNPVKVLSSLSITPGVLSERNIGIMASVALVLLTYRKRAHCFYYCASIFFKCIINNMVFHSVEIVGSEHLPKDGPVILTGNHNNQFIDGIILLTNCTREISFMIAKKSFDRPLVGFLARAFHCIPVLRPQDMAAKGSGKVRVESGGKIVGTGTRFQAEVAPGASLQLTGIDNLFRVKEVLSDVELLTDGGGEGDSPAPTSGDSVGFKILPKVDQSVMYEEVFKSLGRGKCLGIFPEGGSHDRTDLLPLKAGVAIFALDAWSKHNIRPVPIVPVGLNYFNGHKVGGRVVVEFGAPIIIPDEIYEQHETDRRGATEALLDLITAAMRGVIVPTPDYNTLQTIYMARRLYVDDGVRMKPEEINDLNRRFAVGVQKLLRLREATQTSEGDGSGDVGASSIASTDGTDAATLTAEDLAEIGDVREDVEKYMATLKRLAVRDHQVRQIGWWSKEDMFSKLFYLIIMMVLGAIPNLLFNFPVNYIASKLAVDQQKKALKESKVKLAARDVLMSYRIIYYMIVTPALYLLYVVPFILFSSWSSQSIIVSMFLVPLMSFFGMKASEQGIHAYHDLVPLLKRVFQDQRREQDALPLRRAKLQKRLQQAVRKYGPRLGDIYYGKEVDWAREMAAMQGKDKKAVVKGAQVAAPASTTTTDK
eukprot:TRINITY_DN7795_c0_g1_i1.p1 TRINITY_DN7795_c0_g1~~TRINITY_DN7795_c0_g1_i1.p1  ORF type:complete len:705 (-),score=131.20 TRINITY_DN7795_c0_g1_i1:24-2093(-)